MIVSEQTAEQLCNEAKDRLTLALQQKEKAEEAVRNAKLDLSTAQARLSNERRKVAA